MPTNNAIGKKNLKSLKKTGKMPKKKDESFTKARNRSRDIDSYVDGAQSGARDRQTTDSNNE